MNEWMIDGKKLRIVEGNIVHLNVDAVVNAANKSLILGGGVAGAIRNFGGPTIQEECNEIGPIEVGEAVITGGGQLKAKYSSMPSDLSMERGTRIKSWQRPR